MNAYCPCCGTSVEIKMNLNAANDNVGVVKLPNKTTLLSKRNYLELAKRVLAHPGSSKEVFYWITDTIYGFEGTVLNEYGNVFIMTDDTIDAAFASGNSSKPPGSESNEDLFPDFRWIRSFRERANKPLKIAPQEKLLPRLRLIHLAFAIEDSKSKAA